MHWEVCEWLESVGCFSHDISGEPLPGGAGYWVINRTPLEYASELDRQSTHGWYRHERYLNEALERGRTVRGHQDPILLKF